VTPLLTTPDNRYIIVRHRLWRRSNPALDEATRAHLVQTLMTAWRDKKTALRTQDDTARTEASNRVNAAKTALGERGPVWWQDGAPDYTRHLIQNTPYASWFAALEPEPTA